VTPRGSTKQLDLRRAGERNGKQGVKRLDFGFHSLLSACVSDRFTNLLIVSGRSYPSLFETEDSTLHRGQSRCLYICHLGISDRRSLGTSRYVLLNCTCSFCSSRDRECFEGSAREAYHTSPSTVSYSRR
jgi:hypothetical protein